MPVKQFWALTVYDRATFAFIYTDSDRMTLLLLKMKTNADGSVTLCVAPSRLRVYNRIGFLLGTSVRCRCFASME